MLVINFILCLLRFECLHRLLCQAAGSSVISVIFEYIPSLHTLWISLT